MRVAGRNFVTLLLIVVMAIPVLSPPRLRHRHADGNESHRHDATAAARHGHSHSHGSIHTHCHGNDSKAASHSHNAAEISTAAPAVEHDHVFWFGFEISLPRPASERSDSTQPVSCVDQWVPLISDVRLPDPAENGSNISAVDHLMPAALTPHSLNRSKIRPLNQPAEKWLCDTARRERSGVLVI